MKYWNTKSSHINYQPIFNVKIYCCTQVKIQTSSQCFTLDTGQHRGCITNNSPCWDWCENRGRSSIYWIPSITIWNWSPPSSYHPLVEQVTGWRDYSYISNGIFMVIWNLTYTFQPWAIYLSYVLYPWCPRDLLEKEAEWYVLINVTFICPSVHWLWWWYNCTRVHWAHTRICLYQAAPNWRKFAPLLSGEVVRFLHRKPPSTPP